MRISVILGTRPEIIKMSPIIRECQKRRLDFFILHTGQHYSPDLDEVFFNQLRLPAPDYNLKVGSGTHGQQTGKMLIGIEETLQKEMPDVVLVEGDTNTTVAGALAAQKLGINVGHVEAGLRSYDRNMPEEINRVLTDHCSDYLFAPTRKSKEILLAEGIPKAKIFVTGNTIVDAIHQNLERARETEALDELRLRSREFFLVTVHRQENVDDRKRFCNLLRGLQGVADEFSLPVIYPIHPRSRKRMEQFSLRADGIELIGPLDFLRFLELEGNARLVLTDSGGVQEESCILGVACVTLRDNTERPETLEVGSNILAGTDPRKILESTKTMMNITEGWKNPFGDGRAAERMAQVIQQDGKGALEWTSNE